MADVSEIDTFRRLLADLHGLVCGECPALLNEDSGGDSALDMEIRAAIEKPEKRAADGSVSRLPEINAALGEREREQAAFLAGALAMQEAAAKVVDSGQEVFGGDSAREIGPRREGNLMGIGYATAIRAIDPASLNKEQPK